MKDDILIIAGVAIVGIYLLKTLDGAVGNAVDSAKQAVSDAANAVNPFNQDNIIATGTDSITKSITGTSLSEWMAGMFP